MQFWTRAAAREHIRLWAAGFAVIGLLGCSNPGAPCLDPRWGGSLTDVGAGTRTLRGRYANYTHYADDRVDINLADNDLEIRIGAHFLFSKNELPTRTYQVGQYADLSVWMDDLYGVYGDGALATGGTVTVGSGGSGSASGSFDLMLDGQGALAGHRYHLTGEFVATSLSANSCVGAS